MAYSVSPIKRTKIQISNFHLGKLATDFRTYSDYKTCYFKLYKSVKNNDCFCQTWIWLSKYFVWLSQPLYLMLWRHYVFPLAKDQHYKPSYPSKCKFKWRQMNHLRRIICLVIMDIPLIWGLQWSLSALCLWTRLPDIQPDKHNTIGCRWCQHATNCQEKQLTNFFINGKITISLLTNSVN